MLPNDALAIRDGKVEERVGGVANVTGPAFELVNGGSQGIAQLSRGQGSRQWTVALDFCEEDGKAGMQGGVRTTLLSYGMWYDTVTAECALTSAPSLWCLSGPPSRSLRG